MTETPREELPVVVIGAGPTGLAAAAHLLERGLEPLVLEAGSGPGAAVADWGHVRLFSPWRFDIDAAARRLLVSTDTTPGGWVEPDPDALPTGADLVERYLVPLAEALGDRVRFGARVTAVARQGADRTRSLGRERRPWLVRTDAGDVLARAVIDASGTYATPNPLGTSGLPAAGEADAAAFLAGPLPDVLGRDRHRFAGRHALVVGMGHSAANTLLSLVELAEQEPGTRITWAIRGGSPRRLYGGGSDDQLPARGLLGTRLRDAVEAGHVALVTRVAIEALSPLDGEAVRVVGSGRRDGVDGPLDLAVDTIAAATGFRPELGMLREVRLDLDPVVEAPSRIAPLIDPNHHSCGTVPPHGEAELAHPDDGFYLVGMKSYGRAPTFLLATGYEQVRSIAAALAGDRAAADEVQLQLPETGVCSSNLALQADDDGTVPADALAAALTGADACCGVPSAPQPVTIGAPPERRELGFATGFAHGRSSD
ncbi:FAD-dependent oxidoreductase [Myceligenerans pegani]|uniref:NAD(P)-binding domain-containing protein n=1 Tax=Myceligenerans pegani TaxID=2776917 RepID=A0ABR9N064_9MICO|nr:FAD-dependent oxidoreductase [Myceligenerans sp. TRM 65318]MBE1877024.1 NAD(P)-binding domain-containing protein [Myceligenerans sp. TRM 65318]MBE3019295.1 NAD(P)-binding domain-containing protein [Myceligenerans sp. TRM 65318]